MKIPQNMWHPVLLSKELGKRPIKGLRFGLAFVFWRDDSGIAHAFPDRCPHLGASLSQGKVRDGKLICPFHGFEYLASGECTHIPANGSQSRIPVGMACTRFESIEAHGFIWMWVGKEPVSGTPAYFSEIEQGFRTHDTVIDACVNYSRAIENQLDAAHLPFVHRTTIGAGRKTAVDGPYIQANERGIDSWVLNRIDNGTSPATQAELGERSAQCQPSLRLLYPGQWLLNISGRLKNVIAFVPIDEHTTRFYLRTYHKVNIPVIGYAYGLVLQYVNKIILRQDLKVIVNITPTFSPDAVGDRLIGADRAVSAYRRWLTAHADTFVQNPPEQKLKTPPESLQQTADDKSSEFVYSENQ